jgi:hypothetical protein
LSGAVFGVARSEASTTRGRTPSRDDRTQHEASQIISNASSPPNSGSGREGLALDQRLSGVKAQRELDGRAKHLDFESEMAALP